MNLSKLESLTHLKTLDSKQSRRHLGGSVSDDKSSRKDSSTTRDSSSTKDSSQDSDHCKSNDTYR